MTLKDTIEGWGGMGLIEKLTLNHQVKMEEVMAFAPPAAPSEQTVGRKSILSWALRKASELIP
jgi:hypothetical protein